jgi:hypothetical protein
VGHKKIIQPMIDEVNKLRKPTKLRKPNELQKPNESATPPQEGPLEPSELDQDPGGGYNPDGTFPQT